jgi:hypothetical protein
MIFALIVWVIFMGGAAFYINTRKEAQSQHTYASHEPTEQYQLQIALSFQVAEDPFALVTKDRPHGNALLIRFDGKDIYIVQDPAALTGPVLTVPLGRLAAGSHEIYFEATPDMKSERAKGSTFYAARLRLMTGAMPLSEHMLWAEGGEKVQGTFKLSARSGPQEEQIRNE